jgi:DNA polymerase (family X)
MNQLVKISGLEQDIHLSSPYRWGGNFLDFNLKLIIHLLPTKDFIKQKLLKTSSKSPPFISGE